jgi:TetR/AcrR family transcriptional regulator, transcriptional repressor of aconitase
MNAPARMPSPARASRTAYASRPARASRTAYASRTGRARRTGRSTPAGGRAPSYRSACVGTWVCVSAVHLSAPPKRMFVLYRFTSPRLICQNERSFYNRSMPRVTQEHLDARRRQIIDAARRRFVKNGFHATSMQDVLAEADLSAGAVYRYFRGKDDIIAAIADEALAELTASVADVLDSDPLPSLEEVVGRILATVGRLDAGQELANIALQVWAEALRSPALAERVAETFNGLRRVLADLAAVYAERGLIPPDVPPMSVAKVLMAIGPGFAMQRALLGDVDEEMFQDGLRALLAPQFQHSPETVA